MSYPLRARVRTTRSQRFRSSISRPFVSLVTRPRSESPPAEPHEPPRANPPDPILSRRENPGLILPIRPAEFGAPSLQTPTDFNSGYSSPSESTNLGSFDQLYNTWSRRREIANARPLLAAGIRATKTSCSPMCTQP